MEFHQNSTVIPDVFLWNASEIPLEYCFKIPAFFFRGTLKDLAFCHLQENLAINKVKKGEVTVTGGSNSSTTNRPLAFKKMPHLLIAYQNQ